MPYQAAKPHGRVWIAPLLPPAPGRSDGPCLPDGLAGAGASSPPDAGFLLVLIPPDLQADPDRFDMPDLPGLSPQMVRLTSWARAAEQVLEQLPLADGAEPTVLVPSSCPEMALLALALDETLEGPVQILQSSAGSGPVPIREARSLYRDAAPRFSFNRGAALQVEADESVREQAREFGLIGSHPHWLRAVKLSLSAAPHSVPVLIQGETGSGKSALARMIHACSDRASHELVSLNCAALPETLVESLLFGHCKGAFTGAQRDQAGKFVQADGGTLFLDEIGELPLALQPKLLRALEEGVVEPLGSAKARQVDVRILAATNCDLTAAVREGRFREDLYYRLAFCQLEVPALRERPTDIAELAVHLMERLNRGLDEPRQLTPAALDRLNKQAWRGNVRDLENVLGRSILFSATPLLDAEDLLIHEPPPSEDPLAGLPTPHEHFSLEDFLAGARRQLMLHALELADGNQSAAARLLGLTPQAVNRFLQKQDDA